MNEITIRPVTDDEYPAFVTAFAEGFSMDLPSKDFPETIRQTLPPERTLAAFDGEEIVGTFGGYDLVLTVPGGSVQMEGTTVVTVFPTHRRMGLLNTMMSKHLDAAVANGYPVAGLWASESGIYGRHGYGIAASRSERKVDGPAVSFRDEVPIDRVRRISPDKATGTIASTFDRVCKATPGMFARNEAWWDKEVLGEDEWLKRGRSTMRIVVHDGPEGVDGYAIYRQKNDGEEAGHDNGTVFVVELFSETPAAKASLWSYVLNVDGCPNVEFPNLSADDDVRMMVHEPRRIWTTVVSDGLWIRVLDVEAALSARAYERDATLVFSVADAFRPGTEGAYRLVVTNGVGVCERTTDQPSIDLDIDVLGGLYLGSPDALAYAASGRIRGSESDVLHMHQLFTTAKTPWCNQVF